MASTEYRDDIRQAYEGELIGEKLYRKLATRAALDQQKAKLNAIADVEMLTNVRLRPIAERLGIHPQESEYQANRLRSKLTPHGRRQKVPTTGLHEFRPGTAGPR